MDKFASDVLKYNKDLEYFAFKLTYNKPDADDLLQDTYLKALQNRDKFEIGTNLRAWLYTIMKNSFINNYRREQKFNPVSIDEEYVMELKADIPSVNSLINIDVMEKEIEKLSDDKYTCFKLFADGYKYEEICDIVDISIGTVKSRIFFARRDLMKKLTEE